MCRLLIRNGLVQFEISYFWVHWAICMWHQKCFWPIIYLFAHFTTLSVLILRSGLGRATRLLISILRWFDRNDVFKIIFFRIYLLTNSFVSFLAWILCLNYATRMASAQNPNWVCIVLKSSLALSVACLVLVGICWKTLRRLQSRCLHLQFPLITSK